MYATGFGRVLMCLGLAGLFALAASQSALAQSRINDSIARHNGASFFANERTSRNIQHARDNSRGLQRYSTHAQVIQPMVAQAESQMLGQQLQACQRDMVIVRQEHANNPVVVEQVKKIEAQIGLATKVQKSLHEECCKSSPDGKSCAEMSDKLLASLNEMKKEHDKLLKELGHEEAAHHPETGHEHHEHGASETKPGK